MPAHVSYTASPEALFRFSVVSEVLGRTLRGEVHADAVQTAASHPHLTLEGASRHVSVRTLYRWLRAFRERGVPGLEPAARPRTQLSKVLERALIDFLVDQKEADPPASIPELLRRARHHGFIEPDQKVDRTTVWRVLRRAGADTRRRKKRKGRDARRFAYAHRMQMVLCDGKHFRAGSTRAKRVALFFLDDASRYGLDVVVGTSENVPLFLRGLYQVVRCHGLMDAVYLDRGPGFRAHDTAEVVRKLKAAWILGAAGYPQGRGKVERFNRTALADVLRNLDGAADVDPECGALELRLRHFLREQYNVREHASLSRMSPQQRWESDPRALRFPASDEWLRQRFVMFEERLVSNDHVVSLHGAAYEVPRGYAGRTVVLYLRLLEGTVQLPLDGGTLIELYPVDVHANAKARRGSDEGSDTSSTRPPPASAAALAFNDHLGPIVGPDGGFTDPDDQE
ncbi:MAG: hypothetical protein ABFS46_15350 [Myxococcota bacterium]